MSAQKRQLTKPFKVFPAPPNSILYPMGSSKEIDEYGTSPLAPAKSFCKWSRILGFPVCPVDDTEGFDFKFHWSAYLGLAFATGATAGGFLFTHTMFAILGDYPLAIFDTIIDQGMTLTDTIAMYLGFMPNNLSVPLYFYAGKKVNDRISEFCRQFADIPELLVSADDVANTWKNVRVRVIAFIIPILIATGFSTATFYPVQVAVAGKEAANFYSSILIFIIASSVCPPISMSSYAIIKHSLGCTFLCLDKYHGLLKEKIMTKNQAIKTGTKLHKMIATLNNALGGLIFLEFALLIIQLTFSLFFSMLVFTSYQGGEMKWPIFFYGLGNISWSFMTASKTFCYLTSGQCLSTTWSACREELIKMGNDKDTETESQLQILIELMNKPAVIKPLQCFELNWGTGLSIIQILITDLIILLQFRVSE